MNAISTRLFRLCNVLVALTFLLSLVGIKTVSAYSTPWISVWMPREVHGYNWPDGIPVTLTIAHADSPEMSYHSDTTTPTPPPDLPLETWFAFHLPDSMSIQVGDIVTVTNGTLTKTHIVRFAQITLVDTTNDQISGKADPYVRVEVSVANAFGYEQHANRYVFANNAGDWMADFSIPGDEPDEQNTVDITESSWGWANVPDDDGDNTTAKWDHNREIWVRLDNPTGSSGREIDGFGWPLNVPVTLTVNDPATPQSPDHSQTLTNTNPNLPLFFNLDYDVYPGYFVTMTDGIVTKTHTVGNLSITNIDLNTEVVTGTASPDSRLLIIKHPDATKREVTADGSGNWVADFSTPGDQDFEQSIADIAPGNVVEAREYDQDTDVTLVGTQIPPNPSIHFFPWNGFTGDGWPLDIPIQFTADDPETIESPDYQDIIYSQPRSSGTWLIYELDPAVFLFEPGFTLTLDNGQISKSLIISSVQITSVRLDEDTVSGNVEPFSHVQVSIGSLGGADAERRVNADENGNWMVDFSDPGDGGDGPDILYDIGSDTVIWASVNDEDGDMTSTTWLPAPNPHILANPGSNWVQAHEWPNGTQITLTINDVNTFIATVGPNPWGIGAQFDLGDFDLNPGDYLKVTDGITERTYAPTNLAVTGFDLETHTVSGVGEPGVEVQVGIWIPNTNSRNVTPEPDGTWAVSFSGIGDEDLVAGTNGWSTQTDPDGNVTWANWHVPNPNLVVQVNEDIVHAHDWPLGNLVTLTIDDPATPQTIDYTDSQVAHIDLQHEGLEQTWISFNFDGIYDVKTGDVVTLSDGITTEQHVVTRLQITNVDIDNDLIYGIAEPYGNLYVDAPFLSGNNMEITADENGDWIADFSGITDILPGMEVRANEINANDNFTMVTWSVRNPALGARANDDRIEGWEWPMGATLTIELDDPATLDNPDYSSTTTVQTADWDPNQTWFNLDFRGSYDLKPGDVVSVSDGNSLKELIVSPLAFTSINIDADIVYGIADPNVQVNVWACDESGCYNYHTTSDSLGNWAVDMTQLSDEGVAFNIVNGTWIDSDQRNEYGDSTMFGQNVPNPNFSVRAQYGDQIEAWEWPFGNTVTLEIDDPANGSGVDYSDWRVVDLASWDPNQTYVNFDLNGIYDIQPGFVVSLTDGTTLKVHTVTDLAFTDIDISADIVSGIANPNARVDVWACDNSGNCVNRNLTADGDGNWVADFSAPDGNGNPAFDLVYDTWVDSQEWDDYSDRTMYGRNAFSFLPAGTVSGTVYDRFGNLITGMSIPIKAQTVDGVDVAETASDPTTGAYTLQGVPFDMAVYIASWVGPSHPYGIEYWQEAGDIPHATPITLTTVESDVSGINFSLSYSIALEQYTFNFNNPLLADLTIRRAIALGTDRERILEEAFLPNNQYGQLLYSPLYPENPLLAPASSLTLYSYDPATALALLEGDGWEDVDDDGILEKNGQELAFSFKTTDASARVAAAEIFRQNMQAIGIRITVETLPSGEFFAENGPLMSGNFEIAEFAWISMGGGYEESAVSDIYLTGLESNYGGYSNLTLDDTYNTFMASTTHEERLAAALEYQQLFTAELPAFYLFTRTAVVPQDTPAGTSATVTPGYGIEINYSDVTTSGLTAALLTDAPPENFPPNFLLLGSVFNIGSTAVFGQAQVCMAYNDSALTPAEESTVRLYHLEDGVWVDVTDAGYPDTAANIVCGTVTSFSPFAILYSVNQPPVADAGADRLAIEGETFTLDASASSDPEGDPLTYAWDLDNDGQYDDAIGVTADVTFQDNGGFVIGLQVTDDSGLSSTDTATITVTNVAPQIGYIIAPVAPIQLAANVSVNAAFNDPGADAFTATWNWGDGTTTAGVVSGHAVTGSHIYSTPGIYTLKLTVTDDDGGAANASYQYIVIYDPNGGFATGGGWYIDLTSGSKANFGFNAKYQNNSSVPTGNIEFKVGSLNFKSTAYDWLVVSGANAQFKGTGTVNGSGQYAFFVTVMDGQASGGGGVDKFRIKIWDLATGQVIYDNQMGADDDALPTTVVQGGSIVIHK